MMSKFDVNAVATEAANKIIEILTSAGKDVASYAVAEGKKLATSAAEIAKLVATGTIDAEEAKLHLDIQLHASRAVLMAIAVVSIVAAEQAINAAGEIVVGAIKSA